jgi:hypothetical protein
MEMETANERSDISPGLVTYPLNPTQNAQDFRNPKSEVRNPKQVRNSNAKIFKRPEGPVLFFGCFDFSSIVSDCLMSACGLGTGFEIRVSRWCAWFRLRRVGISRGASRRRPVLLALLHGFSFKKTTRPNDTYYVSFPLRIVGIPALDMTE